MQGMGGGDTAWALGCQLRPWMLAWGEAFRGRLPEAVAQLAATGFVGFETRLDYLPLAERDAGAALPWAAGMTLCGAHVGGKWWAPDEAARIPPLAAQAARLPALGCHHLVVSMAPLPPGAGAAELARFAETLGRLGGACREVGVTVVAHNHARELDEDARVLATLVERCAPEDLMLGADLGWVARTGYDVSAFLRRFGPRIAYLHLRDLTAHGDAGSFTEIGRGVLDYPAILATLTEIDYRGWLVVESEFAAEAYSPAEPREIAAIEFSGLRAALAAVGR